MLLSGRYPSVPCNGWTEAGGGRWCGLRQSGRAQYKDHDLKTQRS
jgi:hypothetical protein